MNPANVTLYAITFFVVVWGICMIALCILTLGYMEDLDASDPDKAFIISVLVISALFVVGILVYLKYRIEAQKKDMKEASGLGSAKAAAAKLTKTNAWRDGLLGVLLATWCAMSIAAASMMISYREKKPNAPESDKNFAIACIVISLVVFLVYVTGMFIMYKYLAIVETLSTQLGESLDAQKKIQPYATSYMPIPMPMVQPMFAGFSPQYVTAPATPPPSPPAAETAPAAAPAPA